MKHRLTTFTIILSALMITTLGGLGEAGSPDGGRVIDKSVIPRSCGANPPQGGQNQPDHVMRVQNNGCPEGSHKCITFVCGGTTNNPVCCPRGHPYLSHCDCKCYDESPDCNSYTRCSLP